MNLRDKRHKEIIIWTVLNLIIPVMPICIRFTMATLGPMNISIIEIPELLFYSIVTSVIALSIFKWNLIGCFITVVNFILGAIVLIDIVIFIMFYGNILNYSSSILILSVILAIVPVIIAFIYKNIDLYNINSDINATNVSIDRGVAS